MERKRSFDVIRVVAVLSVIMLHASARFLIHGPVRSLGFAIGNFFDSLARIGVPLFLMISGALLLDEDREIPPRKMLRKILQLTGLLVAWSFLYALLYEILFPLYWKTPVSLIDFLRAFAKGHIHLWYLFMLLGLYLVTPVLRLFVRRKNAAYVLYLMILLFVFSCAPMLMDFLVQDVMKIDFSVQGYANKFMMSFRSPNLLYFLLGWYLVNVPVSKCVRRWIAAAGAFSILLVMTLVWFLSTETFKAYSVLYDHGEPLVVLWSAAVFFLLQSACKDDQSPLWLSRLSQMTFGVYACHLVILYILEMITAELGNPCLELLLNFTICTVVSFAIVWILSKIPVLKKMVRM